MKHRQLPVWALMVAALVVSTLTAQHDHSPVVQPGLGAAVDHYLTRLAGVGFSGAIIVAKGGQVVLEKGYGLAVDTPPIPVTPDTILQIGSITKQFTGAGILKLEMQGRLHVNDRISKYFDGVPTDKAAITIHHLLTHSAGLQSDYGTGDFEQVPLSEFLKRIFSTPLRSVPGTEYEYSNAGFSLLAAIIEKVSGMPWEQFLREQLFLPAGMQSTGCTLPQWRRELLAHGYEGAEDRGSIVNQYGPDGPAWNLRGNGGIVSTVGDMYRWHVALQGDTILSTEEKRKAYTPYIREGPNANSFYGYGWALFTTPRGTTLITHNGGDGVSSADFLRFVDDDVVIFLAANRSRMLAWQVSPSLDRLVFGGEVAWPPETIAVAASALGVAAGAYALPSGGRITVVPEGNRLTLDAEGQDAMDALYGVTVAEAKRFRSLKDRTIAILAEIGKGSDAALREAFNGPIAAERWQAILGRVRSPQMRVVGTVPGLEGRAWTVVSKPGDSSGGALYFVWSEQNALLAVRPADNVPHVVFYPESSNGMVAFNPETGRMVRIGLILSTRPDTLVLRNGDANGTVTARRIP